MLMNYIGANNFESYDVLEDVDFKEGMKEFSWVGLFCKEEEPWRG